MHKIIAVINKLPMASFIIATAGAALSFFAPWPISGILLLGGVMCGGLFTLATKEGGNLTLFWKWYLLLLGLTLLLTNTLAPILRSGELYFGYDTGFYKHYIEQPFFSFPRPAALLLPDSAIGSRILLDLFTLTALPTHIILFGSAALLFVLAGLGFFILTRREKGLTTASIALILFSASTALATAYQLFLWKQVFALVLLLAVYYFLDKKIVLALLTAGLLIISHRTTSVFLLLSVLPTFWFRYPARRRLLALSSVLVAIIFLWWQREIIFFLKRILVLGSSAPDYFAVQEGHFISFDTYIIYSALLLPLTIAGVLYERKRLLQQPFFWLGIASLFFLVFQLPFYKRSLVFFDLSIIYYSAIALGAYLTSSKTPLTRSVCLLTIHLLLFPWLISILLRENTVTKEYLESIRELQKLDQSIPVMVVSSKDAPWVWGWSKHDVIAPGLFQDAWTFAEWFDFWTTADAARRQELLNRYPTAPYIFLSSPTLLAFPLDATCFHKVNQYTYRYTCRPTK